MGDMLVKLYDLPPLEPYLEKMREQNIVIRRPIGHENYSVTRWIQSHFGDAWAGEAENAFFNSPKSLIIAVRELPGEKPEMLGFACYDATVKGFFGPTAVTPEARGSGIGTAMLLNCLHAMWDQGYGYGIIGSVGPVDFYKRVCGAIEIPDSAPGVYKGTLSGT